MLFLEVIDSSNSDHVLAIPMHFFAQEVCLREKQVPGNASCVADRILDQKIAVTESLMMMCT